MVSKLILVTTLLLAALLAVSSAEEKSNSMDTSTASGMFAEGAINFAEYRNNYPGFGRYPRFNPYRGAFKPPRFGRYGGGFPGFPGFGGRPNVVEAWNEPHN